MGTLRARNAEMTTKLLSLSICTFGNFWHFYDAKYSIVTGQKHRLHFSDRNNNSETVSTIVQSFQCDLKHIAGAALRSCGVTTSHYCMLQQVEITNFAWMSEPSSSEELQLYVYDSKFVAECHHSEHPFSSAKTCPRNTDHTTPILSSSE